MKALTLTDDFDLSVRNGSLEIASTDEQNAWLILLSCKGEWKEYPFLGAGLQKYLHALSSDSDIRRQIKLQLSLDDIAIKSLSVENGKILLQV